MKKKILFITILFLIQGYFLQAQKTKNVVDTSFVKCSYQFKFVRDTVVGTQNDDKDFYVIQIGKSLTKGYWYKAFYFDSLSSTSKGKAERDRQFNESLKNMPSNPTASQIMNAIGRFNRGTFCAYLYKDYKKEKITVTDNISLHFFAYEDELDPQKWTILEDTMNILGYSCQKATCNFRGREWEAWFAPDIPINEGPWKFQGLPGLIMALNDTQSHYSFEIRGLQQIKEPIYMNINDKKVKKTNRIQFLRLLMNAEGTNLAAMDLEKAGIQYGGSKKIYDYIERDYK
jgi:GLPGLI family protein